MRFSPKYKIPYTFNEWLFGNLLVTVVMVAVIVVPTWIIIEISRFMEWITRL